MKKYASVYNDVIGAMAPGAIAGVIPGPVGIAAKGVSDITGLGGTVHGLIDHAPTKQQIQEFDKSPGMSYIPGVGISRLSRRRRKQGASRSKVVSQSIGGLTSSLLLTAIAAITGGIYGNAQSGAQGAKRGAVLGAITGGAASGLAHLGGAISAGITDTRSKQQQQDYDQSGASTAANFLIPGFSTYNKFKSYGRLHKQQETGRG